ncbi:RNA 3'-terminal phosphate cyclase [Candidatus Bathyarchaeota archaeon]|nr:RNA 3'-terminal phosphate cyclase [Candidatus Bathyarchaeota archaeon]
MEGGGQLLRMATAYSAILGIPIKFIKIRENRDDPGLKPQHLTTLKALIRICEAETDGTYLGSREIEFTPRDIHGGNYNFDIGTAGSISLFLQCIAPVASFADSKIKIRVTGGTNVIWSPPLANVENVIWKGYRMMGFSGSMKVLREGFYPRGGGIVEAIFNPIKNYSALIGLKPVINKIRGLSISGKLPNHVAERQADSAKKTLSPLAYDKQIQILAIPKNVEPYSPGSVITLWTEGNCLLGADCLGERNKSAENVGKEAALRLIEEVGSGAYADKYVADTLIMPVSLAEGESLITVSNLSNHTMTAINLAKTMTGAEFNVIGEIGKPSKISCKGIKKLNQSWKS